MSTQDPSDAVRFEQSWTLDQALIWLCSRDLDAVGRASARKSRPRLSWMVYRLELSGEVYLAPSDAEELLQHELCRGHITVRDDLDPVAPVWFCEAEYGRGLEVVWFERQARRPVEIFEASDGDRLLRMGIERMDPLFDPIGVMTAYPAVMMQTSENRAVDALPPVDIDQQEESEIQTAKETQVSNKTRDGRRARRNYAASLLSLAYPDGLPLAGGEITPVRLAAAALKFHDRKSGKAEPSKETVLRAAGWR